jgi:outer membrane protein TolC
MNPMRLSLRFSLPATRWIAALLLAGAGGSFPARAASVPTQEIDLATALQLAGARSLDLQMAKKRVAEAYAQKSAAYLQFAPTLFAGASYRRHDNLIQNIEGQIIEADRVAWSYGPSLSLQVDTGDALFKALAAKQQARAAVFAEESQRQESLLLAATAFFDLLHAKAAATVSGAAMQISADYLRQVETAVAAGIAFRGEELRVKVQHERDQLALRQSQEAAQIASARLVQILHLQPGTLLDSKSPLLPIDFVSKDQPLEKLLSEAGARRPEARLSAAQIAAAQHARSGALYGPLLPTVSGLASIGVLGGNIQGERSRSGESADYQIGVGWRIGPGGLFDPSRTQAANARLALSELSAEKVRDEIGRQVMEGWARTRSLSDQIQIAHRAVEAARQTLELTRDRREFAVGNVLEVIVSAQELSRARLEWIRLVADHNKAQFLLNRAVGGTPPEAPSAAAAAAKKTSK